MLAFSITGKPAPTSDHEGRKLFIRVDPFDCVKWCGNGVGLPPESDAIRASRRCTLPGFWRPWTPGRYEDEARQREWQGRAPVEEDGRLHPHPPEDPADGCPGGWARCGFASSFSRYIRTRTEGGLHDANPLIHAGTPAHVLEALRFFEVHQSKADAEFRRRAC